MSIFHPYISYFAQVDFRDDKRVFGIYQEDRLKGGFYILGKTGTGKTNLMESLIYQDLNHNRGMCIMDVNGDLIQKIVKNIPEHRKKDLVFLDTANPNLTLGYNPLKKVSYHYRHLITSHIIETFQKIWGSQSWGMKLQYVLTQTLNALLDQEEATFEDIALLLTDEKYRLKCIPNIISKDVKRFWIQEFPKFSKGDIQPVLTKVGSFMASPIIKKIMVENKNQISMSKIINEGKILVVNLSKGMLGTDSSHLLGSLLLSSISSVGFQRVKLPESTRKEKPFFVYLDEFHNYTTLALANGFSELRKMGISYICAHQYLNQLSPPIRDAVLGNVSNMVIYRCSYSDATYLSKEFNKVFAAEDIVSLENYHCHIRMLINGKPCKAFSIKTLHSKVFLDQ